MATLLLRLSGPLQSWGLDARFGERQTASEPSKSGVIGLACAALGRDRSAPIDDLSGLRMGVRVDREGSVLRDYHTALDVPAADEKGSDTVLSNRWYLSDAVFLVGLEGDGAVLSAVAEALRKPVWALSLGRKACVPSAPIWLHDGLLDTPLERALSEYPPLASSGAERWRLVIEDPAGSQFRPDQPIAPFSERRFDMRRVRTEYLACT